MIKGVNRQIIEVHDTGCRYFERALFFVSAEYSEMHKKALQAEAERVVKTYMPPVYHKKKSTKKHSRAFGYSLCFACGAAACLLVGAVFGLF